MQVASSGAGYIMMHSRGNSQTMMSKEHCTYSDLYGDVSGELLHSIQAACNAGMHTWQLMLDPGIGFAKSGADNLRLLVGAGSIRMRLPGAVSALAVALRMWHASVADSYLLEFHLDVDKVSHMPGSNA